MEHYTNGTSAAAALASRTAHRIHDALEAEYGEQFLALSLHQRAVILKALLVHTAEWPMDSADLIRSVLGPANPRQHVRQRDNIRRFLGYGVVDADDAIYCASDRATFWATGPLAPETRRPIVVPLPACMSGQALPHSVSAPLAWFAPVQPGRQSYQGWGCRYLRPKKSTNFGYCPRNHSPTPIRRIEAP